jgi:hypothetical protein
MGYAIGLGGCVTIFALHVILAYLRKTERQISSPRERITSAASQILKAPVIDPVDLVDPRVAKIISEIPQRRTRGHTYGRQLVSVR